MGAAVLLLTATSLGGGGAQAASAADPAGIEQIRTYAVDLRLTSDNVLHVRETIGYDFGTDHRHGIDRIIPVDVPYDGAHRRRFPISEVRVSSPTGAPSGVQLSSGTNETIRIGDPADDRITGLQSYLVSYDVKGVVNSFADHQELYWNAIGNGWDVPVDASTITVTAPAGLTRVQCYQGAGGSRTTCDARIGPDGTGTFSSGRLLPHQGTTIVAAIPTGTIPSPAPVLTGKWSLRNAFSLTAGSAGGALALLVLLLAAALIALTRWSADRRYLGLTPGLEPPPGRVPATGRVRWRRQDPVAVQFHPPTGVRPAELGLISSARAENLQVAATIIDLAVRGYLSITQEVKPRTVRGLPVGGDWTMTSLNGPPIKELRGYQARLYSAIFSHGRSVRTSDLRGTFAKDLLAVKSRLEDDVTERGWFRRPPSRVRRRWEWAGNAMIAAGAVLTLILTVWTTYAWLGVPVLVTGGVIRLLTGRITGRTARGTAILAQAEGFRLYLEKAEAAQIRFEEGADIFSRYLPYAIVLGVAQRWAAVFAQLAADSAGLQAPDWYLGAAPAQTIFVEYVILANLTQAFADTTSTAFSASPGAARNWNSGDFSNHGSGTPGASGMSGFGAAGGYSGGGEGGGGGGSW